jgi:hypothetical protein
MHSLSVGMKIYDNRWFLERGLSPEAAADFLKDMGVTWVIAQSRLLPMADSAVESAVSRTDKDRYAALDDLGFRNLLRDRGVAYFAVLNICFDPAFAAARPDLLPIDQFGRRAQMQDWYVGLPPDRQENLRHKIGLLERAVAALDPDGVHLGFIRWPGFWETWLSDVDRAQMPDYCYSAISLGGFAAATGAKLPVDDPIQAATLIRRRYRREWRDWKCGVTVEAIKTIRAPLEKLKSPLRVSINTVPLIRSDFDDAVEEVFGQEVARLHEVVDVFEVMAYHQILRRDAEWPASVASDIRARAGKATVCTLQTRPLYLGGMHAGKGRSASLDAAEFCRAVDAVERSEVEGVCVFTFDDLLEMRDTPDGQTMIDRLRAFRR